MSDDELFCPICKEKRSSAGGDGFGKIFSDMGNTQDYSGAYSAGDISANRIFAVISYIPFICIYTALVSAKKSPYVKFHAGQGLVLFIAEIIIAALMWAVGFALSFVPVIGTILAFPLSVLSWAIELLEFAAIGYGIYLAYTGKAKELPVIGKIRILK